MRKIKFRAWDKREGRMIYRPNIPIPCTSESDLYILLQYVGLNDKNGKEAYEGDIVKYDLRELKDCPPDVGFIEWMIYHARFAISDKNNNYYELKVGLWIEIIGNIYENPELLSVA